MANLLSVMLFGEGFMTGVMLTLMLGPVTMIILRYGIQVNRKAGVWAAVGTWVSDFIFIGITYWATTSIDEWTQRPEVRLPLFLAGGFGLLIMGLLMLRLRQKAFDETLEDVQPSYVKAFVGGFLVNSLSPFTLFFWLGAAVFVHVQCKIQATHPMWYYIGVMLALMVGDFSKAWLAPKLTIWLQEKYIYWIQIVAGIVISGTGLYIMVLGLLEV